MAGRNYIIVSVFLIFLLSFSGTMCAQRVIDLDKVWGDMRVLGDDNSDECGWAVAQGDINGDGFMDLIIGAPFAFPGGRANAGETYVIFGSGSPLSTIDLSTESADITISGAASADLSGHAVASGDVNNDGYDDIIIGAYGADPGVRTSAGKTYVIFGYSLSSPPYIIDLLTDEADITICGDDIFDVSGYAVASGDVNGDGYDDIIIGARYASPGGRSYAGETYVIFGSSSPPSTIDLSTQSADITVCGDDAGDVSGYAVSSGDVNDDGYDDIIIGAPWADPGTPARGYAGETYVIFGASFSSPPYTTDLNSISADITICGDDADDISGWAVTSGDVNGDGYHDLIIGAYLAAPGGRSYAGETYLVLGGGALITSHGLGGKSWIKEFSLLANGLNSFKAFGAVNRQGEVHLAIGDLDADGRDEIAASHGEGGKSWVKFFEVDGSLISTFKAFGAENVNGELHLAIGNFDADTSDNEIAIAQGEGGQSWVKTFETDGTLIRSFKAFGAANAQGEVHLAAADLENADGIDEIIAGMGEGGSSMVKIFNRFGSLIRSFKAFGAANSGGEVHLTVGNFDADADLEIAAATGYNGNNLVKLFEKDGTFIRQFKAFGAAVNPKGDVQITAADIDNNDIDELICAHGERGGSRVKLFKADGTVILSFKAFGAGNIQGEVHLGKSNY